MTVNAPGGPMPACGPVFERVDRGTYALVERPLGTDPSRSVDVSRLSSQGRPTSRKRELVEVRIAELIADFGSYVALYDERFPFQRSGQYEMHRLTIDRRRSLGSVERSLADGEFLRLLYRTLQAWGIGRRGSRLVPHGDFVDALRRRTDELVALDRRRIDEGPNSPSVITALWRLVSNIEIVDNKARIVAATKTLHHLLPDLVVPMDRAWTGTFFAWSVADPQSRQRSTFERTFGALVDVAEETGPSQYVGDGWRTSPTKILDNAVIGYCIHHRLA